MLCNCGYLSSKQCTEEHISRSQLTAAIVLVLFVADSRPSQECGRSAYLRPSPRLSLRRTEPCGHSLDHKRLSHSSPCVSPRRCYLGQEMRFQSFAFCVRTLNGPWAGGSMPLNASILVQRDKRTVLESERAPRVVCGRSVLSRLGSHACKPPALFVRSCSVNGQHTMLINLF